MYYIKLKTNDSYILKNLLRAIERKWNIVEEHQKFHLFLKEENELTNIQLRDIFNGIENDLNNVKRLVEDKNFTFDIEPIDGCYKKQKDQQDLEIQFVQTASMNVVLPSLICILAIVDQGLTEEEKVFFAARFKSDNAYRRLVARQLSNEFAKSWDDWDKKGTPDVKSIYVYMEHMFGDIPVEYLNTHHERLMKNIKIFKELVNNHEIFGMEARHGMGKLRDEKENKEEHIKKQQKIQLGVLKKRRDKLDIPSFAKEVMQVWEDYLVKKFENGVQ